jgi:hypothetical protein
VRHLLLGGGAAVCLFAQTGTADNRTPSRFKWGFELRGRFEAPAGIDFDGDHDARFYLNRIRLSVEAETTRWMRVYVQGQDARAFGLGHRDGLDSVAHRLDFRQAYTDFGPSEGRWGARLGRQELAFGDERLIGADNFWDPIGFTFDALHTRYQWSNLRVDAFGAFVVVPEYERLARPATGNRLYGIYASVRNIPGGAVLEPYCIWNQRTRAAGLADVYTYGVRTAGNLPVRFDYNVEVALQRGHRMQEAIRAWAGHWEVGHRLHPSDRSPRLGVEYNFATGDGKPGDGRHSTFDDLYPAGYNKYGMADPFAWRNTRSIAGSVESKLARRWRVAAGYRSFWLADTGDGLYTKGEEFLVWNIHSPDAHVGTQANLSVAYDFSERLHVAAGYARFLPGKYLINSSLGSRYHTPYVECRYRF